MGMLESLLLIYAGLLLINVGLSALLWARQRTPLSRGLFFVWATQVAAFMAQGMAQGRSLAIIYGFSATFFANLAVAALLARVVGLSIPWRPYLALFAAGCILGLVAFFAGAPFWA